jgi:hypothetical protein
VVTAIVPVGPNPVYATFVRRGEFMERSAFAKNLEQATAEALRFARLFVTNHLPDDVRYRMRSDVCDAVGVIERLWQDGAVPVWVDIYVDSTDGGLTYFRIGHTSRKSARVEALRYGHLGCPPFQWVGPVQPFGWKGIEQSGKYDLHWRRRPSAGQPSPWDDDVPE